MVTWRGFWRREDSWIFGFFGKRITFSIIIAHKKRKGSLRRNRLTGSVQTADARTASGRRDSGLFWWIDAFRGDSQVKNYSKYLVGNLYPPQCPTPVHLSECGLFFFPPKIHLHLATPSSAMAESLRPWWMILGCNHLIGFRVDHVIWSQWLVSSWRFGVNF